jgi:hypothetical protein
MNAFSKRSAGFSTLQSIPFLSGNGQAWSKCPADHEGDHLGEEAEAGNLAYCIVSQVACFGLFSKVIPLMISRAL